MNAINNAVHISFFFFKKYHMSYIYMFLAFVILKKEMYVTQGHP